MAATPTDPVAHCTTRRLMNTFYTICGVENPTDLEPRGYHQFV